MKEKNKKVKRIKGNLRYAYIIASVIVLVILCLIILFNVNNTVEQYIVQNGSIENVELASAYVIKQETIIDKDASKIIIPVVASGRRVAKGSIIATYKGSDYENYLEKTKQMDKQILELMKDLPVVYSSEIENIENQINDLIKDSNNENSYIKMQEYKTKINSLISKRAELIGNLSPDGAAVKDLIKKRNKYVEAAKKSNDNVIASSSGIVSYQVDYLEQELSSKNINKLNFEDIANTVKSKNTDSTKIKIVNNYEAYIITKVSKKNHEYMVKNRKYNIRIIGDKDNSFEAILYKIEEKEDAYEIIFKISNGIECLVNEIEIEIEIVWWNNTRTICNKQCFI